MLLNRIQPVLDHHLRPNQNGFRPGRSTSSQNLALRQLIGGVNSNNLPAVLLFLDFHKAFDSVHQDKMFFIFKAYGLPDEMTQAIKLSKHELKFYHQMGKLTNLICWQVLSKEIAPYLFTIVLDYVMREATSKTDNSGFTISRRRSTIHPAVKVSDLDFPDDIALTLDTTQEAQNLLSAVETAAANVGLHLNATKTETIMYNQAIEEINSLNGEKIECVNDLNTSDPGLITHSKTST